MNAKAIAIIGQLRDDNFSPVAQMTIMTIVCANLLAAYAEDPEHLNMGISIINARVKEFALQQYAIICKTNGG